MTSPNASALPLTAHSTFVIERHFSASPARVFSAWSNAEKKRRWFACHDDWSTLEYHLDFRVGGTERNVVVPPAGAPHAFRATFLDIVPERRIIYAYDLCVGEARISVSLVTVTLQPAHASREVAVAGATQMTFTEQVVFLDGHADAEERREGTEIGLGRLGKLLGVSA